MLASAGKGSERILSYAILPSCDCRLVMEAGTKAFVSYVRAYKEHHCKFIFRLQVVGPGKAEAWHRLHSAVPLLVVHCLVCQW